jgi:hypothetical protein
MIIQRPLGKKCNLNDIFHGGKGHFAAGERALLKTWGGLVPTPLIRTAIVISRTVYKVCINRHFSLFLRELGCTSIVNACNNNDNNNNNKNLYLGNP